MYIVYSLDYLVMQFVAIKLHNEIISFIIKSV